MRSPRWSGRTRSIISSLKKFAGAIITGTTIGIGAGIIGIAVTGAGIAVIGIATGTIGTGETRPRVTAPFALPNCHIVVSVACVNSRQPRCGESQERKCP